MIAIDTAQLLGSFADIATFLGIPLALIVFGAEKRRERIDREFGTYDALDDKYLEFLRLSIEHPKLDLYYWPETFDAKLSPEEQVQQQAMFEILLSLLERAFLMYNDQSTKVKQTQYSGWHEYMTEYASKKRFRELWFSIGVQYDTQFTAVMTKLIDDAGSMVPTAH